MKKCIYNIYISYVISANLMQQDKNKEIPVYFLHVCNHRQYTDLWRKQRFQVLECISILKTTHANHHDGNGFIKGFFMDIHGTCGVKISLFKKRFQLVSNAQLKYLKTYTFDYRFLSFALVNVCWQAILLTVKPIKWWVGTARFFCTAFCCRFKSMRGVYHTGIEPSLHQLCVYWNDGLDCDFLCLFFITFSLHYK